MITIDQLLESVDLDFEPRWVAKDKDGEITVFACKPTIEPDEDYWSPNVYKHKLFGPIKLAEFEGKDWTECIYEVPRKTTGKIEKLKEITSIGYPESATHDILLELNKIIKKQNELVDAVNELKAKFALPTLNPDLTDEDLRKIMRDPKYWRDKDSAIIKKVQDGFNKLYGDKN